MVVEVSTSNARSLKALAILATAATWTKGHTKDGRSFFSIPSSSGHIYWTDSRECTCSDFLNRQRTCKHILAVRLWIAQQAGEKAQQPVSRPKNAASQYASLYGSEDDKPYCTACRRHHASNMHYSRMAS